MLRRCTIATTCTWARECVPAWLRYPPAINCVILLCVLINACGIMNPNASGLLFSDVNSTILRAPDFITLCGIRTISARVSLFRISCRNLFVAVGRRGKTTGSGFVAMYMDQSRFPLRFIPIYGRKAWNKREIRGHANFWKLSNISSYLFVDCL